MPPLGGERQEPHGGLHRHLFLRAWRPAAPERLHETFFGRRFEAAPDGGKRTVHDSTLPPGTARTVRIPLQALGEARPEDPVRVELRFVYTIDELPFPGREVAEPTWRTMVARELSSAQLPACAR